MNFQVAPTFQTGKKEYLYQVLTMERNIPQYSSCLFKKYHHHHYNYYYYYYYYSCCCCQYYFLLSSKFRLNLFLNLLSTTEYLPAHIHLESHLLAPLPSHFI